MIPDWVSKKPVLSKGESNDLIRQLGDVISLASQGTRWIKDADQIVSEYSRIFNRLDRAKLDPQVARKNRKALLRGHDIRVQILIKLGRFEEIVVASSQALDACTDRWMFLQPDVGQI
jgi:hypothetical protein